MNKCKALLLFVALPLLLVAQETAVFTDANRTFKEGEDFYEKGLYGQAQAAFQKVMNNPQLDKSTRIEAELYSAKAAVRLDRPTGEQLINNFIRKYEPSAVADNAKLEMGDYYFDAKDYAKAIEFYRMIDAYGLPSDEYANVKFRLGYAYFVRKQNRKAKLAFKEIVNQKNQYYAQANYYYGMTQFYDDEYDEAMVSFQRANSKKQYEKVVPYYILQIQAANENYTEVIRYGNEVLENNRGFRYKTQVHQLVGQAYFEKKQYNMALPHLEKAEGSGKALRKEDFYQLAYCQYRNGKYDEAIKNFREIQSVGGKMGQNALYHLGDCYLKTGNKQFARNSFREAAKINTGDDLLLEEARFSYAKLSYELKYDGDAVDAIQAIPPNSMYYNEAQSLLSDLFLNTNDYERALKTLNAIPNKSARLRNTLHKVTYLRGLQLLSDGKRGPASQLLNKATQLRDDNESRMLAYYWLGDLAHQSKQYDKSSNFIKQFLQMAKGNNSLPETSSYEMGLYTQGYNYMKEENYKEAVSYFEGAAEGIYKKRNTIQSNYIKKQLLSDAMLRAADANFKLKRYPFAKKYYEKVINAKLPNFDYAMYRQAIIRGLEGNNTEKILLLRRLVNEYPKSEKADDALFAMGKAMTNMNNLTNARKPLEQLIRDYPTTEFYNRSLFLLGLISINSGDANAAVNYYKRVFEHSPTGEEQQIALSSLKTLYVNMGRPDDYFAFVETLPGYDVDEIAKDSLNYNVAFKHLQRGDYDKAIVGFTDYIKKYNIHKLDAYYYRGNAYLAQENFNKALSDFEYLVKKGPSSFYVKALKNAAIITYEETKNFRNAFEYYSKYEKLVSGDEQLKAQVRATEAAYQVKDKNAVRQTGEKVTSNPVASDLQKATAHYYIAKMAFDDNDLSLAQTNYNRVHNLVKNEMAAESYYQDAKIHYKKRNLTEVHDYMQGMGAKGLNVYPDWVARLFLLAADAYIEQNDFTTARYAVEVMMDKYKGNDQSIKNEANEKLAKIKALEAGASRLSPTDNGTGNREMDAPIGN